MLLLWFIGSHKLNLMNSNFCHSSCSDDTGGLAITHNTNHVQNCDLILISFLSTSKMCKIGLQAADYMITSPVLCDIVFLTLFIPSGTRMGQNPLQMAEHSAWMLRFWVENPWSEIFFVTKIYLKNIHSLVENECCCMSILNVNITN